MEILNEGPMPEKYYLDLKRLQAVLKELLSPKHPVISAYYWYTLNCDLNFIGHFYGAGRGWKVFAGRSPFEVCAVVCLMRNPSCAKPFFDKVIATVPDMEEVLWKLAGVEGVPSNSDGQ